MTDPNAIHRLEREWERLVRQTRRSALLSDAPEVERWGAHRGHLRMARSRQVVGPVFALLGVGLPFVVACTTETWLDLGAILATFIGAMFLVAGVALTFQAGQLRWNETDGTLVIRYGWWPRVRTLALRARDVSPRLAVSDGSGDHKTVGHTQLWIRHAEAEGEVMLARYRDQSPVLAAFKILQRVCRQEGLDQTRAVLSQSGASRADVPVQRTALGATSANFRDRALRQVEPEVVVFAATVTGRAFWVIAMGAGVMGLVMVPAAYQAMPWVAPLPLAVGGLFLLLGLAGLLGWLEGRPRVEADRTRRVLTLKEGLWYPTRVIPLDSVAAVQLCRQYVAGGPESDNYTTYELNLVLREPPGKRIGVLSHSKAEAVRQDAEAFASFLGVPLLDHTEPEPASNQV